MLYYRVRPEYDQKSRFKFGKNNCLIYDGIYIGNELFTENEMVKEYKTHLVGIASNKMFDKIEISKSKVVWIFGARFEIKEV